MSLENTHSRGSCIDQRAAAEKHNRVLLHALQIAHPVIYQERQHFIHTLTYYQHGGRIETTVYLTGDPTPRRPEEVTLAPKTLSPLEQAQAAQSQTEERQE